MVKDANGRIQIVPKATLTGLDGWIPISDKNLPFELTASFLLMADRPGIPKPIKLPEKLRAFVALDAPLDEETGARLGAWARGTESGASSSPREPEAAHPAADGSPPKGAPELLEEDIAALNAIVTSLSEENIVTKRQVWVAVARMRNLPVDDMIELLGGRDTDGEHHWSPLRDSLEPAEAAELRQRLGRKWAESREAVPA
jgi:hypothetical protein